MPNFFYNMPLSLLGFSCCFFFFLISMAGIIFARIFVRNCKKEDDDSTLIETSSDANGIACSVILCLFAVSNLSNYNSILDGINQEAEAIGRFYYDLSLIPPPLKEEVEDSVQKYVQSIISNDWNDQNMGNYDNRTFYISMKILKKIHSLDCKSRKAGIDYQIILAEWNKVIDYRQLRFLNGSPNISSLIWFFLLLCGLSVVLIPCLFSQANFWLEVILFSTVSVMIGFMFFIIIVTDRPFSPFGISPYPFEKVMVRSCRPMEKSFS